jgi:hypothetical protein
MVVIEARAFNCGIFAIVHNCPAKQGYFAQIV